MLAARVIALGLPTLVVLNMADELHKQGGHVDVAELARQLGTPVALVSATTGEGVGAILEFPVRAGQAPVSVGSAGRGRMPAAAANGPCASGPTPPIATPRPRSGPGVWTPSFCTAFGAR